LQREEAETLLIVLEVLTGLGARLAAERIQLNDNAQKLREAYEHLKELPEM